MRGSRQSGPSKLLTTSAPTTTSERKAKMATKTTNIEVKVDEALASAIADKAVKTWHATSYSNGRKRVYVTFEEVKTVVG